jgi:hypothetical protein
LEITGSEISGKAAEYFDTTIQYPSLNYSQPFTVKEKQDSTSFTLNPDYNYIEQAFFLNNVIHFVFSSRDQFTGYSDIIYCRLDLKSKKLTHADLGLNNFDYVYPSIASIAQNDTDQSVIIGYCKSGSTIYPEVDAVECDNNFNFSPSIIISEGTSPIVEIWLTYGELRWGDYTGMARLYGTNSCFFSGSYGSKNTYETTIAQLCVTQTSGTNESLLAAKPAITVFPNPATDIFNLDFELSERSHLNISIYDMHGKLVALLYDGTQNPGAQRFSFNKAALKSGIYSLVISNDKTESICKKIIIE